MKKVKENGVWDIRFKKTGSMKTLTKQEWDYNTRTTVEKEYSVPVYELTHSDRTRKLMQNLVAQLVHYDDQNQPCIPTWLHALAKSKLDGWNCTVQGRRAIRINVEARIHKHIPTILIVPSLNMAMTYLHNYHNGRYHRHEIYAVGRKAVVFSSYSDQNILLKAIGCKKDSTIQFKDIFKTAARLKGSVTI